MLYISRRVLDTSPSISGIPDYIHYGVVDTDDGVEEIIRHAEVVRLFSIVGLDIKGVTLQSEKRMLIDIRPYQLVQSPLQMKTSMVKAIEVTTYRSIITDIYPREQDLKGPVSIRLSDYGSSVADFALNTEVSLGDNTLTLIIDDGIKSVGTRSFRFTHALSREQLALNSCPEGFGFVGIRFDLRELTDNKLAGKIYKQLLAFQGDPRTGIIDNTSRLEWFCAHQKALVAGRG